MKVKIILLLVLLTSCEKKIEPLVIYSHEELYDKVKLIDTACTNSVNKAKKDIRRGKLSISSIDDFHPSKPFFDLKKMSLKLKEYNIFLDTTKGEKTFTETGDPKLFRTNCYNNVMRDETSKKYNYDFLKALVETVEKEYVLEHPDKIFTLKECDNEYGTISEGEFHNIITKNKVDFILNLIYPEEYFKRDKPTSKTIVDFTVLKDGRIKDVTALTTIKDQQNTKFKSYFEKEALKFVKNTLWMPATSVGIPVNAKFSVEFIHY